MAGHDPASELWSDRSVRCVLVPHGDQVDVELRNAAGTAFLRKCARNREAARNEAEYLRLLLVAGARHLAARELMPFALVVEDDPDHREAMIEALRLAGIRVLGCAAAREGLAHARALSPDLVIVDYRLPDMTGSELCVILRSDPSTASTLIIAVTASPEVVRRDGCPADAILSKPCDPDTLMAAARLFLRRGYAEASA